jgi:hypothetical protein
MAKYNDYYDVELVQVMPFVIKYRRKKGYVEVLSEADADVILGKKTPSFRIKELCYNNQVIKVDENLDIACDNDAFLLLNDDDYVLWAKCIELAAILGAFYGQAREFSMLDLRCLKVWDRAKTLEIYQCLETLNIKVTKAKAIYNVKSISEYYRLFCGTWILDCGYVEVMEYYILPAPPIVVCNKCRRILELLIKTNDYILEDYEQEELIRIKRV